MANWLEQDWIIRAREQVGDIVDRGLDRNVKVAVTGLTRAGKTAFITSLVHQLLHGGAGQLPFFEVISSGRYQGSRQVRQPELHVPDFPYNEALEGFREAPPHWPPSTRGLSEIRLSLKYRPGEGLLKKLSPVSHISIDIIDYPGEWLLDLPLLDLSFADWSQQMWKLCQKSPRRNLMADWQDKFGQLDLLAPCDEEQLAEVAESYTAFLHACKAEGLSMIQPGRFVLPGEMAGAPMLKFCPLISHAGRPEMPAEIPAGSFLAVMQERYDYYRDHLVKGFYRDYFSKFDRQIVLVDCLQALNQGFACYEDMREAMTVILGSFQYGESSLLKRLFSPRIDKILFAATKADHLPPSQHHRLQAFLDRMLQQARNQIRYDGIQTDAMAIASIRATEAVQAEHEGQSLACVRGLEFGSREPIVNFPGELPESALSREQWQSRKFNFVGFDLPEMGEQLNSGLPHIRMDKVLQYLLGDKLT